VLVHEEPLPAVVCEHERSAGAELVLLAVFATTLYSVTEVATAAYGEADCDHTRDTHRSGDIPARRRASTRG
jgi:hypothetical protein